MNKTQQNVVETEKIQADDVTSSPNRIGLLAITLLAWAVIAIVGELRYRPPVPLAADQASPNVFSAWKADDLLKSLIGDSIPHEAGSEQIKVVRKRIVDLLEGWGYDVVQHECQHGIWRQAGNEQIPLVNLAARLPGRESGPAVMLTSHYDSRTGPGASDDGVGTAAVLEIARLFKQRPQPRNDLIFLITDGEEFGLLGADKFVKEHEWINDVEVVINLEARGTTGPSLMFETSDDSQWLIKMFAETTARPMANSLSYEIYKYLPNDTDFTIFRNAGLQGFNFAFIGDVKNYHTLEDNYENADRGSLQHHGQNALALVSELVESDLVNTPRGKAVYFDLFGWIMVWWPESWSLILSLISAVGLFCGASVRIGKSPNATWSKAVASVAAVVICLALIVAIGLFVGFVFSLDRRFELPWPPSPLPIELAYWFAALSVAALLVSWITVLRNADTAWMGSALVWLSLAVLTSVFLSGASYLFVVPVLIASVAGLASCWFGQKGFQFAFAAFAIAAGLIWLPGERAFYDAIGFKLNLALAIRVAIVSTALIPVLAATQARSLRKFAWSCLAAFIVCMVIAVILNPPLAD